MARQNCNLRFVPAIESQIGVNFSVVDWPAAQTALVKCQHIFGIIARLIFLYLTINRLLFRPWERTPRENTSLCKYEVKISMCNCYKQHNECYKTHLDDRETVEQNKSRMESQQVMRPTKNGQIFYHNNNPIFWMNGLNWLILPWAHVSSHSGYLT